MKASARTLKQLNADVVITGPQGFIGKHLHKHLPNARVLERTEHKLNTPSTLAPLITGAKVIFHLAGVNAGSGYNPPNEALVHNNVLATQNLIRAIREYASPKPLVILLSSIHVYRKSSYYAETTELTPPSFYGLTKLTQELLIQSATEAQLLQSVILRTANVYGPGCKPNYNSAIATFCSKLNNGQPIDLMGNGASQVDLIYVDDVVRILLRIFELSTAPISIYNLSSGVSIPVMEIVKHLETFTAIKPIVNMIDTPPLKFTVDNSRLITALNGFNFTPLRIGLAETYHHDWQTSSPESV